MVSTMKSVEEVTIPEGYKQTEVGVIPEDWRIHEFGELVNYIKGYPFKSSEYTNDGIRVIRVSDTTRDSIADKNAVFVTSNSSIKYKKWKLKESDLIFTTVGSKPPMYDSLVGKAIFVTAAYDGSLLNQNAVLIRSKNGASYFQRLLLGHFRTERYIDHIELIFRGNANQASITLGNLFEFKLPIPSDIKEQTAIANALSDVDNLIASLETLIAKKSAIKTAAMQQLLTGKKRLPAFVKESEKQSSELDNTSETAQATQTKQTSTLNSDLYKKPSEGLDTKSNQHSDVGNANNKQTAPRPGYKQTELGEIPEDWEVRVLGESLSIMHGRDQKQVECADGKFPILGTGGEMGRTDSYLYNKPSVLIGRKGSINKPRYMDSPFWTVDTLFYSQVSEKFNAKFIFYKFCMIDWMSYNEASGVPSLNSSTIESVMQVFPETREEQTAIANVLSDMDTELEALQQRLNKTKTIKQGMMQELLTGKTRLV